MVYSGTLIIYTRGMYSNSINVLFEYRIYSIAAIKVSNYYYSKTSIGHNLVKLLPLLNKILLLNNIKIFYAYLKVP